MSPIGKKIKKVRKHLGFTQDFFAHELGVDRAHISKIEREKANPSRQLLKSICSRYSVKESWLLEEKEAAEDGPVFEVYKIQVTEEDTKGSIVNNEEVFKWLKGYLEQSIEVMRDTIPTMKVFVGGIKPFFKILDINSNHPDIIKLRETKKQFDKMVKKLRSILASDDTEDTLK